jgi:hypothetical protein
VTKDQEIANLRFALELAVACLERVNSHYGKKFHIISHDDEDQTVLIDRWIEDWGIQGTINESNDALAGKPLEDSPALLSAKKEGTP